MDITLLLGLSVIVAFFIWIRHHDPRLPPCPAWRLPIFGHLLQIGSDPRSTFKKWRQQCGDIYSIYMGQSLVVVLNGYDLLKEALVTNENAFSDRPYMLIDAAMSGKSGIGLAFSNGDMWKEQRAVAMTSFRKPGINSYAMSERVSEIAAINNDIIGQQDGQPMDLGEIITPSIANVICYIIFGQYFEYKDQRFTKAINCLKGILADGGAHNLANYFPCLSILPGDLFRLNKIKERGSYLIHSFLRENILKCASQNADDHNLENYIAMHNTQRNKKLQAGQSTYLNDENLAMSVYHLFGAGLETVSTTLQWCILYFLHYPWAQEKAYREIEKEVGIDRPPIMSDKNKLPFLNAFINETQRIASIMPLNLMYKCSKITSLKGYTIPEGSHIIPNLDSVLHDTKIWGEDANNFRPERFLDNDGKVKYPEEFIPFSLGKRMCPGATLARIELFLFLSWMVQRFKFLPLEPDRLPSLAPRYGLTACPAHFKVRALERNL